MAIRNEIGNNVDETIDAAAVAPSKTVVVVGDGNGGIARGSRGQADRRGAHHRVDKDFIHIL